MTIKVKDLLIRFADIKDIKINSERRQAKLALLDSLFAHDARKWNLVDRLYHEYSQFGSLPAWKLEETI